MEFLGIEVTSDTASEIVYKNNEQLTGIIFDLTEVLPKTEGTSKFLFVVPGDSLRMIPFTANGNTMFSGKEFDEAAITKIMPLLEMAIAIGQAKTLQIVAELAKQPEE